MFKTLSTADSHTMIHDTLTYMPKTKSEKLLIRHARFVEPEIYPNDGGKLINQIPSRVSIMLPDYIASGKSALAHLDWYTVQKASLSSQ